MRYADGFVLPVPVKNLQACLRMARKAGRIWREHGALEYRECVGDDLTVKMGMPFPRMARLKRDETVVFSWIVFKSRAHRDRVISNKARGTRFEARGFSSSSSPRPRTFRSPWDVRRSHSPEGTRFAQFGDGRKEFARIGATARGVIGFKPFFKHIK